jgi:hypothetical protein
MNTFASRKQLCKFYLFIFFFVRHNYESSLNNKLKKFLEWKQILNVMSNFFFWMVSKSFAEVLRLKKSNDHILEVNDFRCKKCVSQEFILKITSKFAFTHLNFVQKIQLKKIISIFIITLTQKHPTVIIKLSYRARGLSFLKPKTC